MSSENKLCKYIENKRNQINKIIDEETEDSKNFLLNYLIKQQFIFYGKTSLEIEMNMNITLPIYIVSNKMSDFFKKIFDKMFTKYKFAYKPIVLGHKKTFVYTFRLVKYLIGYTINLDKHILTKGKYKYIKPLISLADIYYIYSTPLYNIYSYESLSKIEQKYLKFITNSEKKINNKTFNIKNNKKELLCNEKICKKYNKLIHKKYIKDNKNILLTGIPVLNSLLNTDYIDTFDIIISKVKLKEKFIKLKELIDDVELKHVFTDYQFFVDIYEVRLNNVCLLTYYITDVPFSYYKKYKQCNYHTLLLMLLYKYIKTNKSSYINFICQLINKGFKYNILKNNKFKCFQTTYVKDGINDFFKIKNRLLDANNINIRNL